MNDITVDASTYRPGIPWPATTFVISSTRPVQDAYPEGQEDDFARFHRLLNQWRAQTIYSSFIEEKVKHPAFRQIVDIGEAAIPWILKEIKVCPSFLYLALQIITGENPVPPQDRGKARAAIDAWIEWGNGEGFDTP